MLGSFDHQSRVGPHFLTEMLISSLSYCYSSKTLIFYLFSFHYGLYKAYMSLFLHLCMGYAQISNRIRCLCDSTTIRIIISILFFLYLFAIKLKGYVTFLYKGSMHTLYICMLCVCICIVLCKPPSRSNQKF